MAGINVTEREKKERPGRRAKKRKGIEAQRVKLPASSRVVEVLIVDDEQNGKKKKETGTETPLLLPAGIIR